MTREEEKAIIEVIRAARTIQDFLWRDLHDNTGAEEFRRMFRKRVSKLDNISFDNPHWRVEFRKRLLQVAAIAVNAIGKLDRGHVFADKGVPSNLPEYATPLQPKD
jgi:hypothetical protein